MDHCRRGARGLITSFVGLLVEEPAGDPLDLLKGAAAATGFASVVPTPAGPVLRAASVGLDVAGGVADGDSARQIGTSVARNLALGGVGRRALAPPRGRTATYLGERGGDLVSTAVSTCLDYCRR